MKGANEKKGNKTKLVYEWLSLQFSASASSNTRSSSETFIAFHGFSTYFCRTFLAKVFKIVHHYSTTEADRHHTSKTL